MKGSEKIEKILQYLDINPSKLSSNLELKHVQNIYDIQNDKVNISKEMAKKIVNKYPEFNISWLLTGDGNMLNQLIKNNDNTGIPLIPFDAVAGYGEDKEGVKYEDCERYNVPEFTKGGVEFLIRVSGSSMYPKYSNGDILACKKIHDILFFQWGKVYVIDSSQGQLVKRIFESEKEDCITLVSDNKEKYPPFSIPKEDIRSLSIVLGVVRME